MADRLAGCGIALLTANQGVAEVELTEPRRAVEDAVGAVELPAPATSDIQTFNHLGRSSVFRNAGGKRSDEEVVVDGNLIPSRNPDDLPAFCRTAGDHFANGRA